MNFDLTVKEPLIEKLGTSYLEPDLFLRTSFFAFAEHCTLL